MSLARDAIKSVMLAHALPIAGLLFSGAVLTYSAAKIFIRMERHNGFVAGYGQARDSVNAVTILRLAAQHARDTLRADSVAHAARDSSSALVADRRRFDTAPRYSPRIELLPDSLSRLPRADVVRVIVENTGDTIEAVPRLAAQYWFRSDSMLGVAQRLLNKYAAANKSWSEAWAAEKQAREGADSLTALWRTRALANIAPPPARTHRLAYLALGAVAGFIAAKRIH